MELIEKLDSTTTIKMMDDKKTSFKIIENGPLEISGEFEVFITALFFISLPLLSQSGKINGLVLDKHTGEPLVGARVVHVPSGQELITDFDGIFSFDEVSEGVNEISIQYVSYNEARLKRIIVMEGKATELKIKMNRVETQAGSTNLMASELHNTDRT